MFKLISIAALTAGLAASAMAAQLGATDHTPRPNAPGSFSNGATTYDPTTTGSVNNATGLGLDNHTNTKTFTVNPNMNRATPAPIVRAPPAINRH